MKEERYTTRLETQSRQPLTGYTGPRKQPGLIGTCRDTGKRDLYSKCCEERSFLTFTRFLGLALGLELSCQFGLEFRFLPGL